uniref:Uncharacterized protein n=1 Tax=Terrapene triunguis TaxID=2587831 RepID=A0A674ITT5_9SAUR
CRSPGSPPASPGSCCRCPGRQDPASPPGPPRPALSPGGHLRAAGAGRGQSGTASAPHPTAVSSPTHCGSSGTPSRAGGVNPHCTCDRQNRSRPVWGRAKRGQLESHIEMQPGAGNKNKVMQGG